MQVSDNAIYSDGTTNNADLVGRTCEQRDESGNKECSRVEWRSDFNEPTDTASLFCLNAEKTREQSGTRTIPDESLRPSGGLHLLAIPQAFGESTDLDKRTCEPPKRRWSPPSWTLATSRSTRSSHQSVAGFLGRIRISDGGRNGLNEREVRVRWGSGIAEAELASFTLASRVRYEPRPRRL
ncbi:hypothetical protein EVAR_30650_1 [Eumeta japonica]|uniref:Uncharacterized protein n=1 Tax=Eumeta variegata TaxID=151549 RepID=A0A4C1VS76_EUMVA|nr:hypothetical protein EVAR_30650_1 [Eumeta japonica]